MGRSLPTFDRRQASSTASASPAWNSRCFGIAAEEGPDVPLEADRQRGHRRPAPEPAHGQVDEQVFGGAPGDGVPLVGAGDPLDQGEGPLERAEPGRDLGSLGAFVGLR
jgi:hypothetical protein